MYVQPQQQGYAPYGQFGPPAAAPYGYPPAPGAGTGGYPPSGISSGGYPPSGISSGHGFIGSQSQSQQSHVGLFPPPQLSFHPQQQPLMQSFSQQQGQYNMQHRGLDGSFIMAPTTVLTGHPYAKAAVRDHAHHVQGPAPRKDQGECAIVDNRGACQDEECGGEQRGPKKPKTAFGINWIYLRPLALLGSTGLGGWCTCVVIFPVTHDFMTEGLYNFGYCSLVSAIVSTVLLILYSMFVNAGEMTEEEWERVQALRGRHNEDEESGSESEGHGRLPPRAHKTWLYQRPVLRYDHYCRWLANSIGLRNHRQFFAMLVLLLFIGIVSVAIDAFALITRIQGVIATGLQTPSAEWYLLVVTVAHFVYAAGLTHYVHEIFRIHVMLVARNETAKEWSDNKNWRYDQSVKGVDATWSDMSEGEQVVLKGTEVYRKDLNTYDKGCMDNCLTFWCRSRGPGSDGNF